MRTATTPSYDKLKKVADYFGVTVEYLLHGDGPIYQLAKATVRQIKPKSLSEEDQIEALDVIKSKKETATQKGDSLSPPDMKLLEYFVTLRKLLAQMQMLKDQEWLSAYLRTGFETC